MKSVLFNEETGLYCIDNLEVGLNMFKDSFEFIELTNEEGDPLYLYQDGEWIVGQYDFNLKSKLMELIEILRQDGIVSGIEDIILS